MKKRNYTVSTLALGVMLLSGLTLRAQDSQSTVNRAEGEMKPVAVFTSYPGDTPKSESLVEQMPRVPQGGSRSESLETFTKEMTLWVKNNYEMFEQCDAQTQELFHANRFEELMAHINTMQTTNTK